MDFEDIPILVATLAGAGLQLAAMLAVAIAAIGNWEHTKKHLRQGLVFAVVMLALDLPNRVVGALYTDASGILPLARASGDDAKIAALIGLIPNAAILMGLYAVMVPVTLRAGGLHHAFPVLYRELYDKRVLVVSTLAGVLVGLVSTVAFHHLGIGMGSLMDLAAQLTPDLDREAAWFNWGIVLPAVCAAAIGEELLFRGAVQRWLTRWFKSPWPSIVVTSAFWALLHAPNTDAPLLKLGQIFLLGLALGALAHRHGVESTVLAHVGLNIGATALELGLYS